MATVQDFAAAWNAALASAGRAPASGCGRAYVIVTEKADRIPAKAWAKFYGRIWTGAKGHVSHGIYCGYDNCTGIELGRAEAFAKELKARGINAYTEAMGD